MNHVMHFLIWGNGQSVEKKSTLWNMVFSLLSAVQSAYMVMIAARLGETEQSGMVSIAFAIAYLMYTVAAYGVRSFQVTDTQEKYSFEDYRAVRIFTGGGAIAFAGVYCICRKYTVEKAFCVLCICFLKLADAFEDLYHGELQKNGRLDVACRLGSARLLVNDAVFFLMLAFGVGFMVSVFTAAALSILFVWMESFLVHNRRRHIFSVHYLEKSMQVLKECFPLFLSGFLSIYICNAPKYAIDACLTEEVQTYFTVLYAPVFSINLLSGMFYRPRLVSMSELWSNGSGQRKYFWHIIRQQSVMICCITILIIAGGIVAGLRMLAVMYALPMEKYIFEFAVLLAGGGMIALYNFFSVCLTIMRRQSAITVISTAVTFVAFMVSKKIVSTGGISGAAGLSLMLAAGEMLASMAYIKRYMTKCCQSVS